MKKKPGIYLLSDPETCEPKYIGMSRDLETRENRWTKLYVDLSNQNQRMQRWIYSLKFKGLIPSFTILESCHPTQLLVREFHWFEVFSKEFDLLNDSTSFTVPSVTPLGTLAHNPCQSGTK